MADRIVLIVRYSSPSLNRPVKNPKNGWIAHEMGSNCHSEHQLSHLFQALSCLCSILLPTTGKPCCLLSMPDSFQAASCSCPVVIRGCGLPNGSDKSIEICGRIRGKSTSSSNNAGYHGCDLQTGATSIREALSSLCTCLLDRKEGRYIPPTGSKTVVGHQLPLNWGLVSSSQTVSTGH